MNEGLINQGRMKCNPNEMKFSRGEKRLNQKMKCDADHN